jgi:hypothetical protein
MPFAERVAEMVNVGRKKPRLRLLVYVQFKDEEKDESPQLILLTVGQSQGPFTLMALRGNVSLRTSTQERSILPLLFRAPFTFISNTPSIQIAL